LSQKGTALRYTDEMSGTWADAEFEQLFRGHFERTVRIARRVLRCDAEAEEVCVEAFLRLYRSGPAVVAGGAPGAWLYRVATRAAIDRLRRNKRRDMEVEPEADQSDAADDPLNRVMRNERIAEVRSALARMKPDRAQLLLLRHGGFRYQEIAATMQINAASVGTMLARAEKEFSAEYQRQRRQSKRVPGLQAAKEG
jgi:RNA polymerase sigma-70 factor (ECF subfamily)